LRGVRRPFLLSVIEKVFLYFIGSWESLSWLEKGSSWLEKGSSWLEKVSVFHTHNMFGSFSVSTFVALGMYLIVRPRPRAERGYDMLYPPLRFALPCQTTQVCLVEPAIGLLLARLRAAKASPSARHSRCCLEALASRCHTLIVVAQPHGQRVPIAFAL
jgi:hypothetical protein